MTMMAKAELKAVHIDPSLLTPSDKEMLEDLVMAAYSDAKTKADRAATEKMQSLTAGLSLPPGTHSLELTNEPLGVHRELSVTLHPGEHARRVEDLSR